mgnify:CR=1 FL=1
MNNYFSHDSNARDDEKILAMRIDLGWEAYGLYWALIEMLRDASDYMLKANFKVLAFSLHTTPDLIQQIICNYGLFSFSEDQQSFFSSSLTKRMEEKEVLSKKRRASAGNRWGKTSADDANAEQVECNCNANAMQMHSKSDANAEQMHPQIKINKIKVKESKEYSSPRTREGASAPSEEEKDEFYKIFFWRNLKDPTSELQRFLGHNAQYGWKMNNTPEKRREAAMSWAPDTKGERVSKKFLSAWSEIYKRAMVTDPLTAALMLTDDTKVSACNGALVLYAAGVVIDYVKAHRPPELLQLANGNPIQFSRLG